MIIPEFEVGQTVWVVSFDENNTGFFENPHSEVMTFIVGSIRVNTNHTRRPVSYMMVETGVDFGTVYDEADIFHNKEDAIRKSKELAMETP